MPSSIKAGKGFVTRQVLEEHLRMQATRDELLKFIADRPRLQELLLKEDHPQCRGVFAQIINLNKRYQRVLDKNYQASDVFKLASGLTALMQRKYRPELFVANASSCRTF